MNSTTLLVAAYALVWAFVCGYLFWLARRQERLRREVEALRSLRATGKAHSKGR